MTTLLVTVLCVHSFKLPHSVLFSITGLKILYYIMVPFSAIMVLIIRNGLQGKTPPTRNEYIIAYTFSLFIFILIQLIGPLIIDLIYCMPHDLLKELTIEKFASITPEDVIDVVAYISSAFFGRATIGVSDSYVMKCSEAGNVQGSAGTSSNPGNNSGVSTGHTVGSTSNNASNGGVSTSSTECNDENSAEYYYGKSKNVASKTICVLDRGDTTEILQQKAEKNKLVYTQSAIEAENLIERMRITRKDCGNLWKKNKEYISAVSQQKGDEHLPNTASFLQPDADTTDAGKALFKINKTQEVFLDYLTKMQILKGSDCNLKSSRDTINKHLEKGVNQYKDLSAHADNITRSEEKYKHIIAEIQRRG